MPGGVITSPQNADLHLAFSIERACAELEAELEFRRDAWHCSTRLIARAQDTVLRVYGGGSNQLRARLFRITPAAVERLPVGAERRVQ